MDHTIRYPITDPRDLTWSSASEGYPLAAEMSVRTEDLVRFQVVQTVDREIFEEANQSVMEEISKKMHHALAAKIALAGRMQHGDIDFQMSEDLARNCVIFTGRVMTRERTDGEWPAIHQAYREDQEALRHGR